MAKKVEKKKKTAGKALKILVIHGPNLNLLGNREPEIYGKVNLVTINKLIKDEAQSMGVKITAIQSNHEGKLVDLIGKSSKLYDGILINPAAYTHTSVALRDALLACGVPAVEIHLSNIYSRESFRKESLTAPACLGVVSGFREESYVLGLRGLVSTLKLKS